MKQFESDHGSKVTLSGNHEGIVTIDLDWFEEGICMEAHPHFNHDLDDPHIVACCDCCEDSPFHIPVREVKP